MIQLTCSKCKVILTMDDAFAGGVCRCQHCGTIQAVPRELKEPAKNSSPAAGKALVAKPVTKPPHEGPTLDDLEQVVASSGLGGTDLLGQVPPQTPPKPEPFFDLKHAVLFGAWGLGMFLLGMLVTWLIMRSSGN